MLEAEGGPPAADLRPSAATRRLLAVVSVVLALLTGAGLLVLWPNGQPVDALASSGLSGRLYDGRIEAVDRDRPCPDFEAVGGGRVQCPHAVVRLLQGPDEGSNVELELPAQPGRTRFREGDKVVLNLAEEAERGSQYSFVDRQRKPVLFWLALGFAAAVVILARLRGLAALLGLALSLTVVLSFILPAILDGHNPLLVAVVGAAAIAFVALYLAHGFRSLTTIALLGTLISLALTCGLALVVTELAGLTGYASEEASIVQLAQSRIDLTGLVLAGIVIGALGAIDDMTVTQVAAVSELRRANPGMGRAALFRSALRIGRDHVASTVNTLALAYVGASIPLLLLLVLSRQSAATVANGEVLATEIVRTLVGSIGLVSSVPITTWLAVAVLPGGAE